MSVLCRDQTQSHSPRTERTANYLIVPMAILVNNEALTNSEDLACSITDTGRLELYTHGPFSPVAHCH